MLTGPVPMMEMPRWKCHKVVHALKIKILDPINAPAFASVVCRGALALGSACGTCERCKWYASNPGVMLGGAFVTPEEPRYAGFQVPREYVEKHKPIVGGYYVIYEDGYKSFSPAEAFESGYTRI